MAAGPDGIYFANLGIDRHAEADTRYAKTADGQRTHDGKSLANWKRYPRTGMFECILHCRANDAGEGNGAHWELTIVEPSSNPMIGLPQDAHFDFVAMVPMQLAACLEDSRTQHLVNNLGKILLGGAPVGVSLQKKISDLQIPVYQSYGMTETVSHVALKKLNGREVTGRYFFLPGIHFGTDARGCLFVSGEVTNQEIVQTNDLVEISGNTFEWIGRADNVINSGGVKIILDIVDGLIAEVFHDLNLTNAFFTWYQPDEKLGQKLVLIIEGSAELVVETDILAEIRAQVSAYETPKHVYFVDQFTKTATDKVDKRETVQQLFGS
jgi:O-succinylbenzoic acid--CoA ligase